MEDKWQSQIKKGQPKRSIYFAQAAGHLYLSIVKGEKVR